MSEYSRAIILWLLMAIILLVTGCSTGGYEVVAPEVNNAVENRSIQAEHHLWGIWDIGYDLVTDSFSITPFRTADPHFDVTDMVTPPACDDCVGVHVNSFNPTTHLLDVDITLRNPSAISGRDVRGILYTDDAGHKLTNADAWTNLFEVPGGLPFNPFKAFAKTEPNREFAGLAEYTEKYVIYMPNPPEYSGITYAVTASWPGNAKEPYDITIFTQTPLYSVEGSSALLTIDVKDWQNDVYKVSLVAEEITGQPYNQFTKKSGNTWSLQIENFTGAPAGDYELRVIAMSTNSGPQALYDYIKLKITDTSGYVRALGGVENDRGTNVVVNEDGDIFVGGSYSDLVDFDPGPAGVNRMSNGQSDAYVSRFWDNGDFADVHVWGDADNDWVYDMELDSQGDLYVAGFFSDTVDFDDVGADVHVAEGGSDAYLTKYNYKFEYQWTLTWGGLLLDSIRGLDIDNDGNIYICGYFQDTVDFDPSSVTEEYISEGSGDAFIIKIGSDGEYNWTYIWGGTGADIGESVAIYQDGPTGLIYITGSYSDTVDFGTGINGLDEFTSEGLADVFLTRLNLSGNYGFTQVWGGTGPDIGQEVTVNSSGDVYITGEFSDSFDFDPGPGSEVHTSNGETDIFVSVFTDDGATFNYAQSWGGVFSDDGEDVMVDPLGNVYITGSFRDTVDFDPATATKSFTSKGGQDCFLSKFNLDGDFLWVYPWGSTGSDVSNRVVSDISGDLFVTGMFSGTVDFLPGGGEDKRTSSGGWDAFYMKLLPDGGW